MHRRCSLSSPCHSLKAFSTDEISTFSDVLEKLQSLYARLGSEFPKSMALHRIPLDFCNEDEFKIQAEKFIKRNLQKGVPCLFSVLKALYKVRPTVAPKAFESIAKARLSELEKESSNESMEEKAYTLFFLAQHEDRLNSGSEVSFSLTHHHARALGHEDSNLQTCSEI
jgi:hypothetical protein